MAPKFADVKEIYKNDNDLKENDVKALMDWADKQPHLPKLTELQIILFLQSCYYSNELAKTTIDNYFTVKTICTDLFGNRNPKDPTVQNTCNVSCMITLPKQTNEDYSVLFIKLIDCNPDLYNQPNQIRLFDMITLAHLYNYGPMKGLHLVVDMQGAVFGHLTKLSIVVMKKFMYYLQDAMPIRLKGLHFVNVVSFMDKILAMMKPFMKKEMIEMLYVHSETIDTLYKFVPKECMPREYGGQCDPINILHEKSKAVINDNKDLFEFEESQKVDESKRPGKPKNAGDLFGMEGTFKKLEVD